MGDDSKRAIEFYSRHPISCAIILAKLRESRGHLDGLRPEDLFPHDQDHYGGLEANDALAAAAGITGGSRVADFCAGLGGPARYFAHRYGADVTGIELTPARAAGAEELTRLVGLQDRVRVIEGDVAATPLADGSMDAVVSQEAFLHLQDERPALREAYRILRKGGRLAFTDWIVHRPFESDDGRLLWEGMAVESLHNAASYQALLEEAGFRVLAAEDLTTPWGVLLGERLRMYRDLREEALKAGAPTGSDAFHESYVRFVALVQQSILGGVRFAAEK
jgi:sarcosine/dimethylglycine N-methyltransferase